MGKRYNPAMNATEHRFWSKVEKSAGCWLWTASKRNKGYGAFCYEAHGRKIQGRAHRFSWELHNGDIPDGLFVLHKCDIPACVNPDHLFLGTNDDNIRDMIQKGRHISGGTHCGMNGAWPAAEKHHAAKLTAEKVREMRGLYNAGGTSYSQLARQFGTNISNAFKIVKGTGWKTVK